MIDQDRPRPDEPPHDLQEEAAWLFRTHCACCWGWWSSWYAERLRRLDLQEQLRQIRETEALRAMRWDDE